MHYLVTATARVEVNLNDVADVINGAETVQSLKADVENICDFDTVEIKFIDTEPKPAKRTKNGKRALTTNQRDVLEWVAPGRSNHEIALGLGITENAVGMRLFAAKAKLGGKNRYDAVRIMNGQAA